MNNAVQQGTPREIPVELIHLFLNNQTKELEFKTQELEIAKQEETHGFEVTKLSIKHQADDRENERKHRRELWKMWSKLGLFVSVLLVVVLILALWLGKEQFVLEIVRAVFFGGAGATAGAYYQKSKVLSQKSGESDE